MDNVLKNCWYVAAWKEELPADGLLARTILGEPVLLYRRADGRPVALQDRCPHRGAPLSLGVRIGDTVRCGYHGLRFDSEGACTRIPCQASIPPQAKVRTYPLADRYGCTWIWMGDPARADVSLIPGLPWLEDPQWTACRGYHHVHASYLLLSDNLLDLSHESFVHEDTIGNEAVAEAAVNATVKDGCVRVHRDILDCEPPPFYRQATGFATRINRWHTTIYQPPSCLVIENGSYPANGRREEALERRVINLLTPETETSCHYFWAVARAYRREDETLTGYIQEQMARTFDQDKRLLEAQQKSIGLEHQASFRVGLRIDAGPTQARRLLQSLIDAERKGATRASAAAGG